MLAFIIFFCLCGWCCNRFFYIRDQWLHDIVSNYNTWKKKRDGENRDKYRIDDFDNPMGNIYRGPDEEDDEQLVGKIASNSAAHRRITSQESGEKNGFGMNNPLSTGPPSESKYRVEKKKKTRNNKMKDSFSFEGSK